MTARPHIAAGGPAGEDDTTEVPRTDGILLIGDASFAASVRQVLGGAGILASVAVVPDYLMALGHVAHHPPAVVLGRVGEFDEMLDATARGLRRLLPASRLLLVVGPEEEPLAVQAVGGGFDDYLIEPLDTQELARLVRGGLAPASAGAPGALRFPPAQAPTAAPQGPSAPPTPPDASAPAKSPAAAAPKLHDLTADACKPEVPGSPQPPAVPASELGDVDLVARLLHDPTGMGDLALRVAAANSGIAELTCHDLQGVIPNTHVSAPIVFDGTPLGTLSAPPPARVQDLAPWSAWLGHWMALDRRMKDLRDAALRDELTGVWNRRYFRHFLANVLDRAADERFCVTLMVFDIDDFKSYNDRYGHPAGDDILRETARLMQSVVRTHDVVARIGGDEFAVVFWDAEEPRRPNSRHPQSVRRAAERFQQAICSHRFPKLLSQAQGSLTISGGLAGFPWDGRTPEQLMSVADSRALESKRQGKNALTLGSAAAGDEPAPDV